MYERLSVTVGCAPSYSVSGITLLAPEPFFTAPADVNTHRKLIAVQQLVSAVLAQHFSRTLLWTAFWLGAPLPLLRFPDMQFW